MGDYRTYDFVCALRAVTSVDGMTADFFPFDMSFLGRAATRIINEVRGINRVVYDVTSEAAGHDRVGVSLEAKGVVRKQGMDQCPAPSSFATLEAVLRGSAAIKFTDFQALLQALGFRLERSRGSHRIYRHPDIARPFPIQPEGPDAKRYRSTNFGI